MSEYLRKGELLPVKGYDLSIPSVYLKEGFGFPVNMHYERGELRKRDGRTQLGQPTIGNKNIIHLDTFPLSTLEIKLMAHTIKNIMKYNTATSNWDDVTGVDMSGTATDFFDSCTIPEQDLYIFTNYIDNIRKYNNAGVTGVLGGSPPKAKFVEYMAPYLFLGYVNESGLAIPTKGRWCDTNNPELWVGNNAGSQLFTDDATPIRKVKKLANNLFVYKGGMSYRGWLVSTSDIFNFIPHDSSRGLYSPRALSDGNGAHYFMGNQDFHVNNGVRIDDIGGAIREFIFNRLNRTLNENCFSIHVEQFKEVWFFIVVSGETNPTEVWKYKYDLGYWYKDTIPYHLTGTNYKIVRSLTWDDIPTAWDMYAARWDESSGQADAPIQIFGDAAAHAIYRDSLSTSDNGTVITARQESQDYTGLASGNSGKIGPEEDQEWLQMDFWAKGSAVDIYYSTDFGTSWIFVETRTLTSIIEKHTVYVDVISPQIRFRFDSSGNSGFFTFRSMIPYYLDSGEIEKP